MKLVRFLLWALVPIALVLWRLRGIPGPNGHWLLGHDYSHYLTRLYLGADYFWKNGFSVPHFTPYLCGGIPLFADPQSIFYSLQQFLAFILPGMVATRLTFFIAYLLGYVGVFRLMANRFQTRTWVAHLTAWAFVLNGFTLAHLFVGHITHYPFLFAPWLALALFSRNESKRQFVSHVCTFALVLIVTFYTGGLHVLVVFGGMVLLLLPTAWRYRESAPDRKRLFGLLLLSSLLFLVGTAGQLTASFLYSSSFHTGSIDVSGLSGWELFTRYLWFDPSTTPPGIPFGQWMFGPWEYVGFVTKWTIPAVGLALGWYLRARQRRLTVVLTALAALLLALLAFGEPLNAHLPFFRHYHNPLKILGAFILPLLILAGTMLEIVLSQLKFKFPTAWQGLALIGIALVGLVAEFQVYAQFFISHPATANYVYPEKLIERIETDRALPPVERVITERVGDLETAERGNTSLACYEPLFGYRGEALHSQLTAGPVEEGSTENWNMNHPGCFLYGKYLNCRPWDKIPLAETENRQRFQRAEMVTAWVPTWHRVLIVISFLSVGFISLGVVQGIIGKGKPNV